MISLSVKRNYRISNFSRFGRFRSFILCHCPVYIARRQPDCGLRRWLMNLDCAAAEIVQRRRVAHRLVKVTAWVPHALDFVVVRFNTHPTRFVTNRRSFVAVVVPLELHFLRFIHILRDLDQVERFLLGRKSHVQHEVTWLRLEHIVVRRLWRWGRCLWNARVTRRSAAAAPRSVRPLGQCEVCARPSGASLSRQDRGLAAWTAVAAINKPGSAAAALR